MKTTIEGFLIHETDYLGKVSYDFCRYDPTKYSSTLNRIVVGPCSISVDVPENFDPTPAKIAILRRAKAKISAELTMKCTQLDAQINELLALEHKRAA